MKSTLQRVKVQMTRLMGASREPPAPDPDVADAGPPPRDADLSALAADLSVLEGIIEDSERVVRQAWAVAGDLNVVRRQCSRCEAIGVLAEAVGMFQGLLNHTQHNLRAATKAVASIKAGLSAERA